MEPHDTGQSSYYHHHHHPPSITASSLHPNAVTASDASNGALLHNHGTERPTTNSTALYPQSVAGKAPTPPSPDFVRKKRGRPRKYATPEEAAAAKRTASTSLSPPPSSSRKREQQAIGSPPSSSSSSKKSQLVSEADTGQCFIPHVISVNPGEDVAEKIKVFIQQSRKELCILSASGCVCIATLLQPASGDPVTYEGRYDILSLSGSFVQTDRGERNGGLTACLAAQDGHVIGGGIDGRGRFVAAGPVEVIVATFQIEAKKEIGAGSKGEVGTTSLTSPTNASVSPVGYRPVFEPSGRYPVPLIDDQQQQQQHQHHNVGVNPFMIHHGLHIGSSLSTDWRDVGTDSRSGFNYDLTGQTGHEGNGSPENGDYEQLPD